VTETEENMNLKLVIGMLAVVMMTIPGIAVTQDNQESTDNSTHTATGCLGKGPAADIYMLTDEDGKRWDLRSKTVSLGPHVGHTVTITGTIPKDSKGGNSSGDTSPQNHLLVASLKMVRDNCKQP
jgi:hypothetical protein